jgi:hypothetical protein
MATKVQDMTQAQKPVEVKPINAAILLAFYNGSDAEKTANKVAELEGTRLKYLMAHLGRSEVSDVKEAVKGMKEAADAEAKGDKKAPVYRSAQNRSRDVQLIYGALMFGEWKPEGVGYQKAVEQARETLKAKALRWDGQAIPDAIAKAVRKDARTEAAVFEAAELVKRRAEAAGKEISDDEIEAERERTREAIEKQGARQMAQTLYKRKGSQFCAWMAEAFEALDAQAEQESEKQPEQKAA